jgi:hypothetical protein
MRKTAQGHMAAVEMDSDPARSTSEYTNLNTVIPAMLKCICWLEPHLGTAKKNPTWKNSRYIKLVKRLIIYTTVTKFPICFILISLKQLHILNFKNMYSAWKQYIFMLNWIGATGFLSCWQEWKFHGLSWNISEDGFSRRPSMSQARHS